MRISWSSSVRSSPRLVKVKLTNDDLADPSAWGVRCLVTVIGRISWSTISAFTWLNGVRVIRKKSSLAFLAQRWNPAPGNHAGTYTTEGWVSNERIYGFGKLTNVLGRNWLAIYQAAEQRLFVTSLPLPNWGSLHLLRNHRSVAWQMTRCFLLEGKKRLKSARWQYGPVYVDITIVGGCSQIWEQSLSSCL